MRIVLDAIVRLRDLRAAGRRAERVTRRNVTFSPRDGTLIAALARNH